MWPDLDNSGNEPAEPKKAPPVMAVLEFIGEKKPFVEIPLTYPFRWDGRDVTIPDLEAATFAPRSEVGRRHEGRAAPGSDDHHAPNGGPCAVNRWIAANDV